jgi:hypothetical protein
MSTTSFWKSSTSRRKMISPVTILVVENRSSITCWSAQRCERMGVASTIEPGHSGRNVSIRYWPIMARAPATRHKVALSGLGPVAASVCMSGCGLRIPS